jgi:hypothetical protein
MVISLIGAPLAADDPAADDDADDDGDDAAAELEELELPLPHAATASALTIVLASTTRRWFTASLLSRFKRPHSKDQRLHLFTTVVIKVEQ